MSDKVESPTIKYGKGSIFIPAGRYPSQDEIKAAGFFAERGVRVDFTEESRMRGVKNPDVKIKNLEWEIKTITKRGNRTIEHAVRAGINQSKHLIFDLRQVKNVQQKFI